LARHCTEAGLTEKAAGLWGKAGQRSLDRSALVEAIEQLTRALAQIAALPATPLLRREQIKHQVVSGARAIGQSQPAHETDASKRSTGRGVFCVALFNHAAFTRMLCSDGNASPFWASAKLG
jgi:hypothetical protein